VYFHQEEKPRIDPFKKANSVKSERQHHGKCAYCNPRKDNLGKGNVVRDGPAWPRKKKPEKTSRDLQGANRGSAGGRGDKQGENFGHDHQHNNREKKPSARAAPGGPLQTLFLRQNGGGKPSKSARGRP